MRRLAAVAVLLVLVTTACASSDAPASAEPTPPVTAEAFTATWCEAFDEFTLAVGNDAGAMEPEAAALRDALQAGDGAAILRAIPAVRAHLLEFGRLSRLMGSGWEPGRAFAGVAVQLADRVLLDLAALEQAVRGGALPENIGQAYVTEAGFALYQQMFVVGRALSDSQPGQLGECP